MRKGLAIDAFNKYKKNLKNKQTSIKLKIRIVNALIYPLSLYNCEIWALKRKWRQKASMSFKENFYAEC